MDVHDATATVRETVEFSALLRQPRNRSKEVKIAKAADMIRLLGLDSLSDAIIGSLSVEEKKRVTIAVELAADPGLLLFLDEPTSGLSSVSCPRCPYEQSIDSSIRKEPFKLDVSLRSSPMLVSLLPKPLTLIFSLRYRTSMLVHDSSAFLCSAH